MYMVRHDAVRQDRVIAMLLQDFIANNRCEIWILQPTPTVRCANGQRYDVVLPIEYLFGQVVFSPTVHCCIVPQR